MSVCSHKQTQSARQLDQRMSNSGLFYVRFMDDILVLSPTRWKLRKAVKAINEVPGSLRMEKNPEATVPYCWKHSKKENLLRHDSSVGRTLDSQPSAVNRYY